MSDNKGKKNARFGSRYGSKIRKKVMHVESKYKYVKQICPFCSAKKVSREAYGIYECASCKKKFAGGAYESKTLARRMLSKAYDKWGALNKDRLEALKEAAESEVGEQ